MAGKKYWKCKVCGDIHFGMAGPSPCPTCKAVNAYVEVTAQDAKAAMGL